MTAHFEIKALPLPHKGIIPGAAGHKKVTVAQGTEVFCIKRIGYPLYFWACYLSKDEAEACAEGLENNLSPNSKRPMDLSTMLAWNFKSVLPIRVSRPQSLKGKQPERVGDN